MSKTLAVACILSATVAVLFIVLLIHVAHDLSSYMTNQYTVPTTTSATP